MTKNYDSVILHVNIISLNTNTEILEDFLNSLKFLPDIIVCTETWFLQYYQYFKREK